VVVSVNTAGWTANNSVLSRVDSTADPGAASGGADNWCLKVVDAGAAANGYQQIILIPGAAYAMAARAYAPSANTVVNAAGIGLGITGTGGITYVQIGGEDAWTALSGTYTAPQMTNYLQLTCVGGANNDIAYFDAVTCYQQSGLGYGNLYTPNALVTASMISPAALVTPRAILLRVTDALNFVRLLLYPNTAGTDTILETVTAGVRATVASADVDWTAGGTDKVRVLVQGNAYTVDHMKAGASTWTTAFTTTTASFNTNTLFGVQIFAATDNSFDDILIQPA